ncbi:MAG: citramalate synthase [Lentisphaerae bacterium RIFOXYA12_64_32]|nr:MAG: citramalate synthase [Lentisphaerae bacterium RIFOXYA12_64_32]
MTKTKQLNVRLYDTTLRDGSQGEGVSFSKADKVRIVERLDAFGVSYVEGGWPGSNPKDMGFFEEIRGRRFTHTRVAAFGSTRRADQTVEEDTNLRGLLQAETPVVTIFGKTWLLHVHDVLRTDADTNLDMVGTSCRFLKDHGREVVYDAEHFFDGYADNPEYALATLRCAVEAGATTVVLCDTNGGTLPGHVQEICARVRAILPAGVELGIHCHNDAGCGVANSLLAVQSGARHVQGTLNGFGERCGNADLCSIIPALELKLGHRCVAPGVLPHLSELSRFVYDLANMRPDTRQPYVGESAFAHKGGMHVNAVAKNPRTFEHVPPEGVGNRRRVLMSDLAGSSNILLKAHEHNIQLDSKSPEVKRILTDLKRLESQGYEYESADASFKLLVQKLLKKHKPFFTLEGFRVMVEKRGPDAPCLAEATIKVTVNDTTEITAAEGDGPVNALDLALRKVLTPFYPEIRDVQLRDFKVRILDGKDGTAALTRVLIESGDGHEFWGTVGVSENLIEASWQALVDSVEYLLYERRNGAGARRSHKG